MYCGSEYDTLCTLASDGSGCDECDFEIVKQATDNIMECSSDYDNCFISCNGESSCFDNSIYCRPIGYTSGSSQCSHCVVNCQSDTACTGITVYSFDCDYVEINALGQNSISNSIIYSPTDGGYLTLFANNHFDESYSTIPTPFFINNIIYGNGSSYIDFECSDEVECNNNTFYASQSDWFYLDCNSDSNFMSNTIYCPENNDGACVISFDDSSTADLNVYFALGGIPSV